MNRREVLRAMSAMALANIALMGSMEAASAGQKASNEMYAHCAKACGDCMAACTACAKHCAGMVAAGMKENEKTKRLSEDNADICAAAAKICVRRGPSTAAICEACAQSCDACGAECGKYPNMKQMRDCAASCKVCAKACRDMIKALKG